MSNKKVRGVPIFPDFVRFQEDVQESPPHAGQQRTNFALFLSPKGTESVPISKEKVYARSFFGTADLVSLEFPIQSRPFNSQNLCRLRFVPIRAIEHSQDVLLFQPVEGEVSMGRRP